jgi:hypothetical protein
VWIVKEPFSQLGALDPGAVSEDRGRDEIKRVMTALQVDGVAVNGSESFPQTPRGFARRIATAPDRRTVGDRTAAVGNRGERASANGSPLRCNVPRCR